MSEKLLAALAAVAALPPERLGDLAALLEVRAAGRGAHFARAGFPCAEIGFVVEGLLKMHGVDARARPYTCAFVSEGAFFTDYDALLTGAAAAYDITALEPSLIATLPFAAYRRLVAADPDWRRLSEAILAQAMLELVKRKRQLLTMTAGERFRAFQLQEPRSFQRLAQHEVAAYLGISRVSLSRLRAASQRDRRRSGG